MKEQLDVLGRNSIKDDNLEERPELRFQGFNENWKHEKIGELFDERSEKGYETLDLLSVTINNGVIKRKDIDAKDNSSANKSNYKKVLPNDIVYNSMRMWQGASGKSEFEGIVSPAYTILIPKNVDSDFIGYLFKKETTLYQFRKYSQGLTSDTWNLKYPLISQIKINVPDLKEQIKIRNFLRCVDKKIVFMQKTLFLYQKHKNYFYNFLFDDFIKNIFTEKISLNNICEKIENGYSGQQVPFKTEFPVTRIETISAGKINYDKVGFVEEIDESYRLQKGDILLTNINSLKWIGNVVYFEDKKPLYHGMNLMLLRPKKEFNSKFIYYYITFHNKWFKKMACQAVSQASINKSTLQKFEINIPTLENQHKIVELLSNIDTQILNLELKLMLINKYKKGLLQKMFV